MAVRRGVAVGGDRDVLPAAARRARRPPGPRDALAHAGARRPARGAGRARALPARSCARCGPRRTGSTSRRPTTRRWRRELERSAARYAARGRRARAPRRPARRLRAARELDVGGHARRAAAARHRRRRAAAARDRDRLAPRALRRLGRRLLAARVRARAVARPAARGGRRARRPASTSPTCSGSARALRRCAAPAGAAARADRPRARSTSCGRTTATRRRARLPRHAPAHTEHATRAWAVDGAPYDPARGPSRRARDARDFVARPPSGDAAGSACRARHRAARPLLARGRRVAARP